MGEEFYCVIKLVSGEEIFSLISIDENNDDPIIILQNPVVMDIVNNQKGSFIKIKSWMELTDDDMFIIKPDKIITMAESRDEKIIEIYNCFISEDSIDVYIPAGKVNLSEEMGYVSSVEESKDLLEKLYKISTDPRDFKES
jgi:hypothetical protein